MIGINFHLILQMQVKVKNSLLWEVQSIYEFQYFNCPSCAFKHGSKQDFVNHISIAHPESVEFLRNISDDESLGDILCPWTIKTSQKEDGLCIKNELFSDDVFIENATEKIPSERQKFDQNGDNILATDTNDDDFMEENNSYPTYGDLFFELLQSGCQPSNDENYSDQVIDWIKTNIFQSTSSTLLEKEVNFVKKFALSFQQEVNALWKNNSGRINYGLSEKIDCFLNKVIDYENFVNISSEKMIHQDEENLLVIELPATVDLAADDNLELPGTIISEQDQIHKSGEKSPKLSYSQLIYLAIQNQPEEKATLLQIYNWIIKAFPYYSK